MAAGDPGLATRDLFLLGRVAVLGEAAKIPFIGMESTFHDPGKGAAGRTQDGISVVIPVLNDRQGLAEVLETLLAQDRLPDELVVVDGGSTDSTLDALGRWPQEDVPLNVLVSPGINIAAARNAGVGAARHPWIACTDAGCHPARGWLAAIDAERARADFVAGVVRIEGHGALGRVLAVTHYPDAAELDSPSLWVRLSHRAFGRGYEPERVGGAYMAFTKRAWESVGGFPEHAHAGEDRGFATAIVDRGLRVVRTEAATVGWRPPAKLRGNASMFFTYSRGDIRFPGRKRHVLRAAAWLLAGVLLRRGRLARAVAAAGGAAYVALPVRRAMRAGIPVWHWWMIPLVVAVKDLSQLAGASAGLADLVLGRNQPIPGSGVGRAARAQPGEPAGNDLADHPGGAPAVGQK